MKKINIGLIGLGTIGAGVAKALRERAAYLERRIGVPVLLKRVCDLNAGAAKRLKLQKLFTKDVNKILSDPTIDIVIELIGGIHPAREFIIKALKNKKHVVTANKALLSEHGAELFEAASANNVDLYFEASVAGGIPIIKSLREGLVGNQIETIFGIINGTSNYILSKMTEENLEFSAALREAQKEGYAERNPSLDIKGTDSAHKLAILSTLAFGKDVPLAKIYVEGIDQLSNNDIRYADDLGYIVKLLAIAKRDGDELEVRVHPTLLPKNHLLAAVGGVYNAIYIRGDLVGRLLLSGRGAGRYPTTSAVVADIVDIARNIKYGSPRRVPDRMEGPRIRRIRPIERIEARYYFKFSVIDKPGVLAKISGILGRHHISIASVSQKERRFARIVPVVILTHEARERDMRNALDEIDRLAVIKKKTVVIRIEKT